MTDHSDSFTRRGSLQLILGVTALGLALGKKTVDAKEVSQKLKGQLLDASEKSTFSKLSKTEQSLFIKLTASERSSYSKLTSEAKKSEFLKLNAD